MLAINFDIQHAIEATVTGDFHTVAVLSIDITIDPDLGDPTNATTLSFGPTSLDPYVSLFTAALCAKI